jgi:2-beta-glucuronyltransferase
MKVVLVTHHAVDADRMTGFHFWADLLDKQGIKVDWITVGFSRITGLKKNARTYTRPYNVWVSLTENLQKYVWRPLLHPADLGSKSANLLAWPLFALYPRMLPNEVRVEIADADLFIVESGAGGTLVPELAKLCPSAKFLYNFSDRYSVVKYHPIIPHTDKSALRHYDMIRVNAAVVAEEFPPDAPVVYIPQAIDKTLFDSATVSPYRGPRNAISIGDMLFDAAAIETLAERFPDWTFHVFGRSAKITKAMPNVIEYGEFPFTKLVPYLRFADIGLAPYRYSDQADYLSQSSLKMVQYTYCQLPIVAPFFAAKGRDHVIPYEAANVRDTIASAFDAAIGYDRSKIDKNSVLDWQQMLQQMMSVMER